MPTAPDGSLINDTGCGNTLDFAQPCTSARLPLTTLAPFRPAMRRRWLSASIWRRCSRAGPGFDARGAHLCRDQPPTPGAGRPGHDRRAMGHRPGRIPARPVPARLARVERPLPRRRPPVLARRRKRPARSPPAWPDRRTCFRKRNAAASTSSPRTTASPWRTTVALRAPPQPEANGEGNRDGHGENFSWNNGAEGPTHSRSRSSSRTAPPTQRALLGTLLFASHRDDHAHRRRRVRPQPAAATTTPIAQDNPIGWIDWHGRDRALEAHVAALAARRAQACGAFASFPEGGRWCRGDGRDLTVSDWEDPAADGFVHQPPPGSAVSALRVSRLTRTVSLGGERCD
jgi:glycogen operon protein